ncbi:GAF domain-containing sensor histidine kinase [Candidatus Caldatribacterium sp. SIUC1]|uniref:GAF domain-containing sensor histidine kinase n=1 Tax=Candidatus Caldatribacterium sp. SIUC1 TaxID=3418365 RepID=UPI003F694CBC
MECLLEEEAWCADFPQSRTALFVLREILRKSCASSGTLAVFDPFRKKLRVVAAFGLYPKRLRHSPYLPSWGVAAHVLQEGQGVIIDALHSPPLSLPYRRCRDTSSVCVPLRGGDGKTVLGVLSLNRREGCFSPEILLFLEDLLQEFSGFLKELRGGLEEEHLVRMVQKASRVLSGCDWTTGFQGLVRTILRAFQVMVPTKYAALFALLPTGKYTIVVPRELARVLSSEAREELGRIFLPLFRKKHPVVCSARSVLRLLSLSGQASWKVLVSPLYWRGCFMGAFVALVDAPFSRLLGTFLAILSGVAAGMLQGFALCERARMGIVEQERLRIARSLHDGVAQSLAGAEMCCRALREMLRGEEASVLLHLERFLSSSCREAREILRELRGEGQEDRSFALREALLERLDYLFGLQGVHYDLRISIPEEYLPFPVRKEVFAILEECLMNVWKHAGATALRVTIGRFRNAVYLVVWDNGKGFCPEQAFLQERTFGLRGIRERVAALGGMVRVRSRSSRGTRIGVVFPVHW